MGNRHIIEALIFVCLLWGGVAALPQVSRAEELTPRQQAHLFWQQGYVLHLVGEYEAAIGTFRRSIEVHPTAEAHTFLGWSLSMLGRYEEAIAECERAIPLDPDYGNPYNDIGVYLIELDRAEEAVPWLKKAMRAKRYCCYQFPYFNLGRVLVMQRRLEEAKQAFERALEYDPDYPLARKALELIREHGPRSL